MVLASVDQAGEIESHGPHPNTGPGKAIGDRRIGEQGVEAAISGDDSTTFVEDGCTRWIDAIGVHDQLPDSLTNYPTARWVDD